MIRDGAHRTYTVTHEETRRMDIHEFQETGEQARRRLGIDGTAGDAQDIRHPFVPTPGARYCLACGLNDVPGRPPHALAEASRADT